MKAELISIADLMPKDRMWEATLYVHNFAKFQVCNNYRLLDAYSFVRHFPHANSIPEADSSYFITKCDNYYILMEAEGSLDHTVPKEINNTKVMHWIADTEIKKSKVLGVRKTPWCAEKRLHALVLDSAINYRKVKGYDIPIMDLTKYGRVKYEHKIL